MDWKKLGKKLLFPPVWMIIVLTILSAAALVFVFIKKWDATPIAYIVYVLSFYALSVLCIFLSMVLPNKYRQIRKKIDDNPIGHRYMTDAAFRTHISLYVSLAINLLYAGVNILSVALYHSKWFAVLAGYYMILAVMRFLLVRYVRRNGIGKNYFGELRSAMVCSGILLLVNFVLSGSVLMILYESKGYEYHGILIYVMAMYTFYITTSAIVSLVKYRKYKSPVMTMTKIIALSAALVSMLSLETAMFSQFGQDTPAETKWIMIALTGAGISAAVVTMSVYMIVKVYKQIKEIKEQENGK